MADADELTAFVRGALAAGESRPRIEAALAAAGWDPAQVRRALGRFADVEFPLPVPRPSPYLSARDAFLYLVMFTTLYTSACSLGAMLFQVVDRAIADAAAPFVSDGEFRRGVRASVASLVVAYPVFALLFRSLNAAALKDPVKRASKIRKWLTYMTLFVAAGVLIGDLIALVNGALSGDLRARFAWKVAIVGAIAGGVFGYYLWDLRQDEKETAP